MSDTPSLLDQAKAHARKDASLSAGATLTESGKGEAHFGVSGGWKRLKAAVYAKVLLVRGKKPEPAAGFDVEIDLK